MNPETWMLILLVAPGLLIAGGGIPMIQQKVPPNRWYGYRTPSTLADPRIWYPANRTLGWVLVWTGLFMMLLALGTIFIAPKVFFLLFVISTPLLGAIALAIGYRKVEQLKRTLENSSEPREVTSPPSEPT